LLSASTTSMSSSIGRIRRATPSISRRESSSIASSPITRVHSLWFRPCPGRRRFDVLRPGAAALRLAGRLVRHPHHGAVAAVLAAVGARAHRHVRHGLRGRFPARRGSNNDSRRSRKAHRLRADRRIVARRATSYHPPDRPLLVLPRASPVRSETFLNRGACLCRGYRRLADTCMLRYRRPAGLLDRNRQPIRMEIGPPWRFGTRRANHRRLFTGADSHADRLDWAGLRANASHRGAYRAARSTRAPHHRALCLLRLARSLEGRGTATSSLRRSIC
jgi:hypothetical protein